MNDLRITNNALGFAAVAGLASVCLQGAAYGEGSMNISHCYPILMKVNLWKPGINKYMSSVLRVSSMTIVCTIKLRSVRVYTFIQFGCGGFNFCNNM